MGRTLVVIAAISGFIAVAAGAFGTHGLRNRLAPEMLTIYQTGVQYHFYHTLALLACGVLIEMGFNHVAFRYSGIAFVAGIVIFSGSLYVLALTGMRWLGAVTPLGGLAFLVGWLALAYGMLRSPP